MSRRIATAVVIVVGSSVLLTGCDGQLEDAIESGLPTELPTALPTDLPTALPTGDQTDTPAPTEPATEEPATEEPPTEEPATEATPEQTAEATADETDDAAASSAIPTWAWVALTAALIALIALVVASARRRQGVDPKQLTAQADGQLAWVRQNVDDPLVRWRADQLKLPEDQRDTESELARRWALVDERVSAATNDLLTLESGSKDASVAQAAGLLRQATEGLRRSLDGLTQALATDDQNRIAQASQGFAADVTLVDQGRQRLRQAAKL